jgi:hypothetical protein
VKKVFQAYIAFHGLFVLSGVCYSLFWILKDTVASPIGELLFPLSLLFGMGGVLLAGFCVQALSSGAQNRGIRYYHILILCIVIFAATTIVTKILWNRPFTSELPFLLIWFGLESGALLAAYRNGWLSRIAGGISAVLVVVSLCAGIYCYSIHYNLDGTAQFYNGLIPYSVISVVMLVNIVLLLIRRMRTGTNAKDY